MNPAERFAVAVVGSLLVILLVWCGGPGLLGPTYAPMPAEHYFPDHVSAAVRLKRFEPAFEHYWTRRGFPETDTAIAEILRAIAPWDEWREDLSEAAIERRITAFREAFFHLMGPESWLVFGQWEPEEEGGPPETALLLFLQEGAAVRLAVAPFLDLMLPEKQTVVSEYRGVEILQYISEHERDDWTLARMGGWVCISMRNRNSNALPRIIDQHLAARDGEVETPPSFFGEKRDGDTSPSLKMRLITEPLWKHVIDLEAQRLERDPAQGENENRTERWQRRLRNISQIDIVQATDAFLDLDFIFQGPRIERLETVLRGDEDPSVTPPLTTDLSPEPGLPISAAQIDFSYPMASRGLRYVGLDWDDFLDEMDDLDSLAPGLERQLENSMYEDRGPSEARLGAAITRRGGAPFLGITVWRDHPPILYTPHSPADTWTARALARHKGEGDLLYSVLTGPQREPAGKAMLQAERDLANRLWQTPSRPPEIFLVFHWDEVLRWMDDVPLLLARRSDSFETFEHFTRGMKLATGSMAARFDVQEGVATLRFRTLEAPQSRAPAGQ